MITRTWLLLVYHYYTSAAAGGGGKEGRGFSIFVVYVVCLQNES